MKRIRSFIGCLFSLLIIVSACSNNPDNYKTPDAGIKGTIIDSITNQPFQSEEPNGYKIRLIEQGYDNVVPIDFWGKANGTFEDSKLFTDKYKVIPIEGAFFEPDTQLVNINGMTSVSFTVTPFLELTNVSVKTISGGAIVQYQISRTKGTDKILTCKSLASEYPSVSNSIFDKTVSHDLSGITDSTILKEQFSDTLTSLSSGTTYYIRAAATTNNAINRYNYSKEFTVTIK